MLMFMFHCFTPKKNRVVLFSEKNMRFYLLRGTKPASWGYQSFVFFRTHGAHRGEHQCQDAATLCDSVSAILSAHTSGSYDFCGQQAREAAGGCKRLCFPTPCFFLDSNIYY